MSSDDPFWFANTELLTELLQVEVRSVKELSAEHPAIRDSFGLPDATPDQRATCFLLLAHRALMDEIYEEFTSRYEESPSLGDEEQDALRFTRNLYPRDAPAWVLELEGVIELLPSRIYDALPEPLRRGGFRASSENAAEVQLISSTASKLSNVDATLALIKTILSQQLQRLEARWLASRPVTHVVQEIVERSPGPAKRKGHRTHDKQRVLRDKAIAAIDDAAEGIHEFLKLMDERNVRPQPTWSGWPGSWRKAYLNPRLRELIHKDKSRAIARSTKRIGK